jgi:protein-tyrosine phosphatase
VTTSSPAAGLINLRDVGGLRTEDGARVRHGVLYRSELPPAGMAPPDLPVWPPRTVVDLRTAAENGAAHPLAGPDTVTHAIDLAGFMSPEAMADLPPVVDLTSLYVALVTVADDAVARIAGIVAAGPGPVLVHCTAGKDRTGIVTAIVLRAVGVRREDVDADYLATRDNLDELWARLEAAGTRLPHDRPSLMDVRAEALAAALHIVEAEPGGAAGWLTARSGDPDLVPRLRALLVG